MDINWGFQQENARLQEQNERMQSQIKRMSDIIMSLGIPEDDDESESVLTKSQANFVRALELDYVKIYRLAKKYKSGFDAIEEIMEVRENEAKRISETKQTDIA